MSNFIMGATAPLTARVEEGGTSLIDVGSTIGKFAADWGATAKEAGPVILGAVIVVAGVMLGIKFVKKFIGKIG